MHCFSSRPSRRRSCATPTSQRCIPRTAQFRAPGGRRASSGSLTATRLIGAVALYLKSHSYGEYVFDWAWADAYRRHGLRYYPKALGAAPFTPVQGTRLLARDAAARVTLVRAIRALAVEAHLSSAHVLFIDEADRAAFEAEGWMLREGVQFHWTRDGASPAPDFAAYLATMQRHKRKNIAQERRRVADAGITFTALVAAQIDGRRLGLLPPLLHTHL